MDDGEENFPSGEMLPCIDMIDCPFDIDELLGCTEGCSTDVLGRTQSCTHAHACSPSGPDKSHMHTCIHVHTQIMPSSDEPQAPSDDTAESVEKKAKKRPLGNREAVRKYREKKKARTASLEDEVIQLRAINQQLMKRLQGQALLEAEIARLKCLLVDIRGRIEGEIGSFPYQKPTKRVGVYQSSANPNLSGSYTVNPCSMQWDDLPHCLHPGSETALNGQGLVDSEFDNLQCSENQNSDMKELLDCGAGNVGALPTGSRNTKGRK